MRGPTRPSVRNADAAPGPPLKAKVIGRLAASASWPRRRCRRSRPSGRRSGRRARAFRPWPYSRACPPESRRCARSPHPAAAAAARCRAALDGCCSACCDRCGRSCALTVPAAIANDSASRSRASLVMSGKCILGVLIGTHGRPPGAVTIAERPLRAQTRSSVDKAGISGNVRLLPAPPGPTRTPDRVVGVCRFPRLRARSSASPCST